jgi:hypothetical protein
LRSESSKEAPLKKAGFVFALLLVALPLSAQLISGPATHATRWPVVGDLDGDGLDDVIDNVTVEMNVGGALSAPTRLPISGRVLDVLDVDGDHVADLLITGDSGMAGFPTGPYALYLNDGHGHFTMVMAPLPAPTDAMESMPVAPLVADFDGDGKDDLILGRAYPENHFDFTFQRGRGDGTFVQTAVVRINGQFPAASMRQHVPVGDVNGDGKPDIVLKTMDDLVILIGRGDGTFEPPVASPLPYFAYGTGEGMQIADIDGDGFADIVWIDERFHVRVLLNDRHGHFTHVVSGITGKVSDNDNSPRTTALLHYSSEKRFDIAVGADPGLVVVMTYSGGAMREAARIKLLEPPAPSYAGEDTSSYRRLNVFRGKFRADAPADLYAYQGWGYQSSPASLVFVDPVREQAPPRRRIAGTPVTIPRGAAPDTLTLRFVPNPAYLITGICTAGEELWDLEQHGNVYATGSSRSGGYQMLAVFDDDRLMFQTNRPFGSGGKLTRGADGLFHGPMSWKMSCRNVQGDQSLPTTVDASVEP